MATEHATYGYVRENNILGKEMICVASFMIISYAIWYSRMLLGFFE